MSAADIPAKQFLLLALCLKPQADALLVHKTTSLIEEWSQVDPSFVMCVDEEGNTPLHLAAKSDNSAVCLFLIDHTCVRLNRFNSSDQLAIHFALQNRNLVVFEALVKRSPSKLITRGLFGSRMETLLHLASRCDTTREAFFVGRLVCAGADPLQRSGSTTVDGDDTEEGANAYEIAKTRNPSPIAALLLNNYLVNRITAEGHANLRPEDIDDDLLECRKAKRVAPADGYSATERRLIFDNPAWWSEGAAATIALAEYMF